MKKLVIGCFLAAVMCVPAMADFTIGSSVDVKYLSVDPAGTSMNIRSRGHDGGVYTGIYKITVNGENYDAFCIDIHDYAPTTVEKYTVQLLENTPDPTAGPMGTTKATELTKLLSANWKGGMTSIEKAALQLAVWEVVDEYNGTYGNPTEPYTYDLTSGDFYVHLGDKNITDQATLYLGTISSYDGPMYNFVGLTNNDKANYYQDYVVRIPAPGAILLGSIGTALVGYLRRKRSL